MNEAVKKVRTPKKAIIAKEVNKLDLMLRKAHEEYYETNEALRKYAGRTLLGNDLKEAEALVIKMDTIYSQDIDPIIQFISLRHPDVINMAHAHYEWRAGNAKINEKSSILDPNIVN